MLVQLLKVLGSMTAHHIALLIDDVRPRAHERLRLHGFKLLVAQVRSTFLILKRQRDVVLGGLYVSKDCGAEATLVSHN